MNNDKRGCSNLSDFAFRSNLARNLRTSDHPGNLPFAKRETVQIQLSATPPEVWVTISLHDSYYGIHHEICTHGFVVKAEGGEVLVPIAKYYAIAAKQ